MNEEDDQVSVEKNSSLLKEKTIKTQSPDPELNESIESKVDRVLKGERGIKKRLADPHGS